jgi:hypothetical protein
MAIPTRISKICSRRSVSTDHHSAERDPVSDVAEEIAGEDRHPHGNGTFATLLPIAGPWTRGRMDDLHEDRYGHR